MTCLRRHPVLTSRSYSMENRSNVAFMLCLFPIEVFIDQIPSTARSSFLTYFTRAIWRPDLHPLCINTPRQTISSEISRHSRESCNLDFSVNWLFGKEFCAVGLHSLYTEPSHGVHRNTWLAVFWCRNGGPSCCTQCNGQLGLLFSPPGE